MAYCGDGAVVRVTLDHGNAPPCGVRWATTSEDGTFFTRHKTPPASAGTSNTTMTSTLMSTVRRFLGASGEGGGVRSAPGSAWATWSACVVFSLAIHRLLRRCSSCQTNYCADSLKQTTVRTLYGYCMALCGATNQHGTAIACLPMVPDYAWCVTTCATIQGVT